MGLRNVITDELRSGLIGNSETSAELLLQKRFYCRPHTYRCSFADAEVPSVATNQRTAPTANTFITCQLEWSIMWPSKYLYENYEMQFWANVATRLYKPKLKRVSLLLYLNWSCHSYKLLCTKVGVFGMGQFNSVTQTGLVYETHSCMYMISSSVRLWRVSWWLTAKQCCNRSVNTST